jgi:hypothetical protein
MCEGFWRQQAAIFVMQFLPKQIQYPQYYILIIIFLCIRLFDMYVFVYVLACCDPPLGGAKESIGCHETP